VEDSLGWYGSSPPLVDIVIPTYNESLAVLERTLVCCLDIDYPRYRVWLLDDGRREHVRQFAEDYGIYYLRRETNEHFKAGNLNHGIAHIMKLEQRPDFIAVLDSDFMPRPQFLQRTIALMKPPGVGLVQTPQVFFNPDPIQYAFDKGHLPDEQRFFFDEMQVALDTTAGGASVAALHFSSERALSRRSAGFPPNPSPKTS